MAMKCLAIGWVALALLVAVLLPTPAVTEAAQGWTGTVVSSQLNVRTAPSVRAPIVTTLVAGEKVAVVGEVRGQAVENGYATWYRTKSGYYVYARYVLHNGHGAQPNGGRGRWIDVNLSKQIATAMVNGNPIYGAEVTIGRIGWRTPSGIYPILHRVANETMDSATIGIPRNSPDGYYLTNVLYTQYFTKGGHSLHYNYWVDPAAFGHRATSRGCIGLKLADAKFFWDFARIGTPVVIHY